MFFITFRWFSQVNVSTFSFLNICLRKLHVQTQITNKIKWNGNVYLLLLLTLDGIFLFRSFDYSWTEDQVSWSFK